MSDFSDYPIHEGYGVSIFAQVEYGIEPASGDSWNEPREEAHAYVIGAALYRVDTKHNYRFDQEQGRLINEGATEMRTDLGEAPAWVLDIVRADTDWLGHLMPEDGPDYDDREDEAA